MLNFSRRSVAFDTERGFLGVHKELGFKPTPPAPVIDRSDHSVLFTGATINAVKLDTLYGRVPVPGNLLVQDCVRLQNLKSFGDPTFAPQYMSCFRMFSVCANPSGQRALSDGVMLFLNLLKNRWGATVTISYHSAQTELLEAFALSQVAETVQHRPEPMKWTYGLGDQLVGVGVDIMVGNGEVAPRSTGQLVQLFAKGEPAGYEFGFGMETLGSAVSGGLSPFDAGELAEITMDNNEPLCVQMVDTIVTLQRLHDAGLRPGHDSRGSTMRKMLRLLPAVAERVGFDRDQVNELFDKVGPSSLIELTDSPKRYVSESWKKRDDALQLASRFIDNQKSISSSGGYHSADATVRTKKYLERLGKLLPIEIDEMVRNM
jgi:hypothetical protein